MPQPPSPPDDSESTSPYRNAFTRKVLRRSLVGALNVVDALTRTPRDLALLLEATSVPGLVAAGRFLEHALRASADDADDE